MDHILSVVLWTPLVGLLVLLVIPSSNERAIKMWANIASFIGFLVCLPLLFGFDRTQDFQFVEKVNWIPSIGASYHLGIDGFGLLLVVMTGLLSFLSILSSWNAITFRLKEYYGHFLLLEFACMGVFMALDFFLFFVFWELVLVPMYFIIAIWGGPRRVYSSIKFVIFTLFGSILMLLGILTLYHEHYRQFQVLTFDIGELIRTSVPAGHAMVDLLGTVHRLCGEGADVPVSYVAAGRAHRSAHGRISHTGERSAEDGHVRPHPFFASPAA